MNSVLVHSWYEFMKRGAGIIVKAFAICRLHPLRSPQNDSKRIATAACAAAMQCGKWKKANELDHMVRQSVVGVQYTTDKTDNPLNILRAK